MDTAENLISSVASDKAIFGEARRKITAPPRLGIIESITIKWKGRRERSVITVDEHGRFTSPTIRQFASQAEAAISGEWRWCSGDCSTIEKKAAPLLVKYENLMRAGEEALASERYGDSGLDKQELAARKASRAQRLGFAEARKIAESIEPLIALIRDRVVVAIEKELYIKSLFEAKCSALLAAAGLSVEDRQLPSVGRISNEAREAFFSAHDRYINALEKGDGHGR